MLGSSFPFRVALCRLKRLVTGMLEPPQRHCVAVLQTPVVQEPEPELCFEGYTLHQNWDQTCAIKWDINRILIEYPIILDRIIKWDYWIWFFFQIQDLLSTIPGRSLCFSKPRGPLSSIPGRGLFVCSCPGSTNVIVGHLWTRIFQTY